MNHLGSTGSNSLPTKDLIAGHWRVDVWDVPLHCENKILHALRLILSPDEQVRAQRFRAPEHRDSFTATRGILRTILSRYVDAPPESLTFSYQARGKPYLPHHPSLKFNLAHSAGRAVYAIARDDVGIDLEQVKPWRHWQSIATRFFSPKESAELTSLAVPDQISGFFSCWTRKEAFIKATGEGMTIPLSNFYVGATPSPSQGRIEQERFDSEWYFQDLRLGEEFKASLVTRSSQCEVRMLSFDSVEACLQAVAVV